ncbi:MAG: acyl carrier protein [Eubacterium sp.]|nr:acyl carrier protein [Eubacterium sp.]
MVFDKLREILAQQLELDETLIMSDSLLLDDLGADSLDVIDIIMSVEDEFQVEVPDELIEDMSSVSDMVEFLESREDVE